MKPAFKLGEWSPVQRAAARREERVCVFLHVEKVGDVCGQSLYEEGPTEGIKKRQAATSSQGWGAAAQHGRQHREDARASRAGARAPAS